MFGGKEQVTKPYRQKKPLPKIRTNITLYNWIFYKLGTQLN